MPALVHAQARAPHVVAVATVSVAVGVIQLASGYAPVNIGATTTHGVSVVWSLLLAFGGLTVLVGAFVPPVIHGLLVEGVGHIALAGGTLTYVVAAIATIDGPWFVSPAIWWAGAVAVASLVRWWQIWRAVRLVTDA